MYISEILQEKKNNEKGNNFFFFKGTIITYKVDLKKIIDVCKNRVGQNSTLFEEALLEDIIDVVEMRK